LAGRKALAKEEFFALARHAFTPYWVQASAWQQLSLMTGSIARARHYLSQALEICDLLEMCDMLAGDCQDELDMNSEYRQSTVCFKTYVSFWFHADTSDSYG